MISRHPPSDPAVQSPGGSARAAAIDFLLGRINYEHTPTVPYGQREMKLDRMRQLLVRLGSPDAGLPIVHVAGTKGKGSTSALVAGILQASGYQTGLFSSPHLERIEERFVVNGVPCAGEELVSLVDELRPAVRAMDAAAENLRDGSLSPTYFELTTALALLYFARRQVDVAVLEVGLGGRLDATNVCQPVVTVISSISLDHTQQLGATLPQIAREKAGIIKPGVPLLCGPLRPAARAAIAEVARHHGCRMVEGGRDYDCHYEPPQQLDGQQQLGRLDVTGCLSGEPFELLDLSLRLIGTHQATNAALAVAVCQELRHQGWSISPPAIRAGLAQVILPARIEVLGRRPTVVLDVAHNVASAVALVEALLTSFASDRRILVLAATSDKDVPGIVRALVPHFQQIFLTAYQDNPRAVPVPQLRALVVHELEQQAGGEHVQLYDVPLPQAAWQQARAVAQPDQLICVTGSFFIAAELRAVIANQ